MYEHLELRWRNRAEEPGFAIALALLEVARAIERLGFNDASPSCDVPGPIEKIAIILQDALDEAKCKE